MFSRVPGILMKSSKNFESKKPLQNYDKINKQWLSSIFHSFTKERNDILHK